MPASRHPNIRIVPFEKNMLARVAAAYQTAWGTAPAYAERFTDDEAREIVSGLPDVWIALDGDEIAGFTAGISVRHDDSFDTSLRKSKSDAYYIDSVVVMQDYRKEGLGGRLLELLLDVATRQGFREFLLRTTLHESNEVPSLYRRHGFQILSDSRGLPVVRVVEQDRVDGRSRHDARIYMVSTSERREFARAVKDGLSKPKGKSLPNRFFYDRRGSQLFERICELPEYYPPRCETAILEERKADIALACTGRVAVVELGSGNAIKTRIVLRALLQRSLDVTYLPIDISAEALHASAAELRSELPTLAVHPLAGDYESGLGQVDPSAYDTVLFLWLGTSIGNLEPRQAEDLLRKVKQAGGPNGLLVLGVDLKKDKGLLEQAYNDAQGVTAQFNLNLLDRINRELGGRFDLAQFEHKALYEEDPGRIEMHIVSRSGQVVPIEGIETEVSFEAGETIHTENSYKFTLEELQKLARVVGMQLLHHWKDPGSLFSVNFLRT